MENLLFKLSKSIKCNFIVLIACLGLFVGVNAQNSKGTDFWLMFPNNYVGTSNLTIFITSDVNTSGSISGSSFASIPFVVSANTVTAVILPSALETHTSDLIDNKGIHITSLDEITVYGLNQKPFTTDAYLGLPTDALGTNYRIISYQGPAAGLGSAFGIVGTVNGTVVTITPSVTAGVRAAGIPYTITLDQGQSYYLEVNGIADITGTLVDATQPIGVLGSVVCVNVPTGCGACDHIVEMLPPTPTFGEKFGAVPLAGRDASGDQWRFLASENSTTITMNGVVQSPVLNAGQFMERAISIKSVIESDKPILVAQYAKGLGCSGNITGDPFMMMIPSFEQYLSNYTMTTVSGFTSHYINIVAPNAVVGTLTRNGVVIPAGSFTAIGTSGFSGAAIAVSAGSHVLNATAPFGATIYGWNNFDSYGYGGGQSFSPVATVSSIVLTPATGTIGINTNQCWQTLVQDQFNNPVENIRVDYTVTGVNSQTGFSFTDASGISTFCYTGSNPGDDTITANVGTLTDAATFNWTSCLAPIITCPGDITLSADPGLCSFTPTPNCPTQAGFDGQFAPANWSLVKPTGGDGSIDVTNAPTSITLTGSDTGSNTQKITSYQIVAPCKGSISFKWDYVTNDIDGSSFDPFGYMLNGSFVQLSMDGLYGSQTGSSSIAVQLGDIFAFTIRSTDDRLGASVNITSDFLFNPVLNATATGGCGVVTLSSDAPAVFPVGTTIVTWTAIDEEDNTSTCSFNVTVEDNEAPVITCPDPVAIQCASLVPDVDITSVTATDNCTAANEIVVTHVGDVITPAANIPALCTNKYSIARTYKATDEAGNEATCTQTITVDDTTAPMISIDPLIPFVSKTSLWPPNHKMVDIYLSASDNCGSIVSSSITITSNEPVNDIGDGNTDPDWWIDPLNPLHIQLRAERSGVQALVTPDIGRIYTITVNSLTDACGNVFTGPISNTVTVAHNITSPNAGTSFKIGTTIGLAGTFWDIPGNIHTAKWSIDGASVNGAVIAEPNGNKVGKVTGSYKPTVAGVYKLQMNVTDQKGVTSYASTNGNFEAIVVAYDPSSKNYTYGGGKFMSPAGALKSNPTATGLVAFGFTSNYYKNSTFPKGETLLDFKVGDFTFSALNFDYLVVSGVKAQFKGLGKMTNGLVEQSGLAFILTVIDGQLTGGGGVDKIRMKIYNKKTNQVYYDNQSGSDADAPVTPVESGSTIVIGNAAGATIISTAKIAEVSKPEPSLFHVKAYPNPANHQFTLVMEGGSTEKIEVMVYDIFGRMVNHIEKSNGEPIQFGEKLPRGYYTAIVKQGSNQQMVKLIKQE
jgi:hypothetical protein